MKKMRVLVAHDDKNLLKEIVNSIQSKNLNDIEIVGTTQNGEETYNQIVELKPEVVFSKYEFRDIDSVEIMRLSKEKLGLNIPYFNIIGEMPNQKITEAIEIVNEKLTTLIQELPYTERINDIIENQTKEKL